MKQAFLLALALFIFHDSCSQSGLISDLPMVNMSILDSVINNYQVIFTGENHYYTKENTHIKLEMMRYLNEKAGVRNLILELGFSRGHLLNEYINNDSSFLTLMRYTTSNNFLAFYRELRTFNLSLPLEKRFKVHGIDVERFADDGPILLAKLLPREKPAYAKIEFGVEVIRSYGAYSAQKYKSYYDQEEDEEDGVSVYNRSKRGFFDIRTIDTMINDYNRNKKLYMEFVGKDSTLFNKVFESIIEYRKYEEYNNMPHQYIFREMKIYENLTALMFANPSEKYYGQFGRCHISQTELNEECNWWAFNSVAKRLNEGSAKDRVLSIGIFYNDKKTGRITEDNYFENDLTREEVLKYINVECDNKNIFLKIDRKDTNLSKHYQYLILNNKCNGKTKNNEEKYEVFDYHEWVNTFDLGIGVAQYNFNNLNKPLGNTTQGFNEQVPFISLGWSHSDFGFYTNNNIRILRTQEVINGPIRYRLGGHNAYHSFGVMPHVNKRFAFGISGILGYSKLNLKIKNDSTEILFSPGFTRVKEVKYVNNGFVLGGGIDLRFAFSSWIGLYVRADYLHDVSKKSWKQSVGFNNIIDRASPQTSVGYYSIQAGISFIFQQ